MPEAPEGIVYKNMGVQEKGMRTFSWTYAYKRKKVRACSVNGDGSTVPIDIQETMKKSL